MSAVMYLILTIAGTAISGVIGYHEAPRSHMYQAWLDAEYAFIRLTFCGGVLWTIGYVGFGRKLSDLRSETIFRWIVLATVVIGVIPGAIGGWYAMEHHLLFAVSRAFLSSMIPTTLLYACCSVVFLIMCYAELEYRSAIKKRRSRSSE